MDNKGGRAKDDLNLHKSFLPLFEFQNIQILPFIVKNSPICSFPGPHLLFKWEQGIVKGISQLLSKLLISYHKFTSFCGV